MKFELITLPYAADALEPAISAETIAFHHGKHLAGYVSTLNSLIEGTEYDNLSLEEIVKKSEGPIFNNAGQLLNHNLYFTSRLTQEVSLQVSSSQLSKRSGVALKPSKQSSLQLAQHSSVLVGLG